MKDTDYTFAVARIRSNETRLLNAQELNAVVSSAGYDEAVRRLNDKGYEIDGLDYGAALNEKLKNEWELIESLLPDKKEFDSILLPNDFKNLKLILKAFVCEKDTDGLFSYPCVYDPEELKKLVFERKNGELPECLRHCDRSAYRILTQTRFAQLADSVIDRASMEWAIKTAKTADNTIMSEIAETVAAVSDIKILYRCILAGKARSFAERAVCECEAFDKSNIIKAALSGMDDFLDFVSHTKYSALAEALKESPTAFEKACDDALMKVLYRGKYETFGIAAVAAYYFAVKTEIMNVRIILSAKLNGLPDETIRERMRLLYV